jgi:hypothetical protein
MTGHETNNEKETKMETMHWGDEMVATIEMLKAALAAGSVEDDPSELRAEIARLEKLLD